MSDVPPLTAALWAGAITVILFAGTALGGALLNRRKGKRAGSLFADLMGTLIVLSVPLAAVVPLSALGGAALRAAGTSPLVYLFVALAGLAGLGMAVRAPGQGMEGCSKLIGLFASLHLAVWGAVMFLAAGGPAHMFDPAAGLGWLKPPLAALPFALAVTALAKSKRTRWTFPTAWAVFMLVLALFYFPIEAGLGAAFLPASDWLRFPLAGLAIGALLSAVQLLGLVGGSATMRARRARAMPRQTLLFAVLVAPTGLAWAVAREVTG